MNIAIDLTSIPKKKSGVGRYLKNLLEHLQRIDNENIYYLFIHDDDLDGFEITKDNFKPVPVKSRYLRKVFLRLLWEQFILPFRLKKLKIDLLHSPHYTMPYFSSVKNVVTFHDMSFFIVPKVHTFAKRYLFRVYMWLTSRRAYSIISVSHATVEDIKRILRVKGENIYVTPLGVDQRFFTPVELDRSILKTYGIDGGYFLHVGMIEPRKNIVRIMKAYNSLPEDVKKRYKLIICGRKAWMYDDVFEYYEESGLGDKVVFTDFVQDEHLQHIYKGARLLLYVSLYEGFGLPLVEAMASGVPCITSDLSSMKEVAGDAGLRVNPYDEDEIRNAILRLLKDDKLYSQLIEEGYKQAQEYRWANCAQKTLEVYSKTSV